jgi:nicotinamide mononucleotide transporter
VIDALLRGLALSGPLEGAAVLLGVVYVLLILKQQRLGWVAGGVSSAIYVYLAATARLPMQSLLNAYYVTMAFYGWFSWTRAQQLGEARVTRWPMRFHGAAVVVIVLVSVLSSHWLALETRAAWPFLDSLTAAISLLATWLVARMKLENWLYWIAADAITAFLFAEQGHPYTSALFVIYLSIAGVGFFAWLRLYRRQAT